MSGTLYLVATPIGNLEDMSFRAVRTLKEVDLIACEDTRTSRTLLSHFEIKTPVTSYHEFNKFEKADELLDALSSGKNIALITDAGTPGISDPGEELVAMAFERGLEVVPIPGACAFVNAAISSAQSVRRIAFEAFLPKDKKERQRIMSELKDETRTIVIYEAPHHLKKTLTELSEVLGGSRSLTLVRELTKKFEEKRKTTFDEALSFFEDNDPRGEYVLVIEGKSKEEQRAEQTEQFSDLSIEEHVLHYINEEGMDKKSAMKAAAKDRGVSKRDIYAALNK
ncbi:MAG: 16S rRNA (cytidine(1402)-2'-O)-methyltransferase [Lachnospiraceae bacterium]|nr:16S rRNA (cytidine(1402)-2'-O)-methyltransferase [Lachnospiraceae bacterium]